MPLPAALAAIGQIGGAMSTVGQLANMVGGNEQKKPPTQLGGNDQNAMKRRQGVEENKMKLEQLKQAAMQLPNVPPDQAQQYGPTILAALQAQGQQMRG